MRKKRIAAVLLAAIMLAGCGVSAEDKEKIEGLQQRVTSVDTEITSMYGRVEDMHSTAQIDDDTYNIFIELDDRAEKLKDEGDTTKDADAFEQSVQMLENDLEKFKKTLEEKESQNDVALSMELVEVSLACEEQEKLMQRAFENGKITQEQMDEFSGLKAKIDMYSNDENLVYDEKFKTSFNEIRQKLTTLASAAGADNALIDRLMGQNADNGDSTDNTENAENTEATTASADREKEAAEESTVVQPLPDNVSELIDNYLALQDFALEKQSAGEITDAKLGSLLKIGVELTYLKEAVEKDGVTENNSYTMSDIKSQLYDKAVEFGYENAEVFKQ